MLGTIVAQLTATESTERARLERIAAEARDRNDREETRLRQEESRLQIQREHMDKEESILAEETSITELSIRYELQLSLEHCLFIFIMHREQTEAEQSTKSSLTARIVEVGNEITALERQLLEKRQEEKKLRSSLDDVDAR
jgi:hypothetical protein